MALVNMYLAIGGVKNIVLFVLLCKLFWEPCGASFLYIIMTMKEGNSSEAQ